MGQLDREYAAAASVASIVRDLSPRGSPSNGHLAKLGMLAGEPYIEADLGQVLAGASVRKPPTVPMDISHHQDNYNQIMTEARSKKPHSLQHHVNTPPDVSHATPPLHPYKKSTMIGSNGSKSLAPKAKVA